MICESNLFPFDILLYSLSSLYVIVRVACNIWTAIQDFKTIRKKCYFGLVVLSLFRVIILVICFRWYVDWYTQKYANNRVRILRCCKMTGRYLANGVCVVFSLYYLYLSFRYVVGFRTYWNCATFLLLNMRKFYCILDVRWVVNGS